jgi:Septum formation initiator.
MFIKKCKDFFCTVYRSVLRPVFIIFGLIALAAYAAIMLRGPQGLAALAEKQNAAQQLEVQNANMRKQNDEQRRRIERLKHDPDTQESIVRQRTGKTRPGDTSFVVPDQPKRQAQQ